MNKTKKRHKQRWLRRLSYFGLGALIVSVCMVIAGYVWVTWLYQDRIVPGVRVLAIPLSGMTLREAEGKIEATVQTYQQTILPLVFEVNNQRFEIKPTAEALKYEAGATAMAAFQYGRNGTLKDKVIAIYKAQSDGVSLPLKVQIDESWWEAKIASIGAAVNIKPIEPILAVNGKKVTVTAGSDGQSVNERKILNHLYDNFRELNTTLPSITIEPQPITASAIDIERTKTRAESMLNKTLNLALPEDFRLSNPINIAGKEMVTWMNFKDGYEKDKLEKYLRTLAQTYDQKAQNAKFHFDESTQQIIEFVPAQDGLELDVTTTLNKLQQSLKQLETQDTVEPIELSFERTKPEIGLNEVNNLGIKELIGRGFSTFKGSIPSRVHNVTLAASRISGTLVKPGEVFSFNQAVGEVTGASGYQKAYIIRNGRTELDDGGGVCQVSTTVFRAALNAGLPITERRAHAYRVGYYEQNAKAGLDATVFSPTTDLKFVNDTPQHIIVQTTVDTPNRALTVDIYGTSDGRKSEIKDHVIWDIVAAPPDIYQDDPTLPNGTIKQVEHAVKGAKAKFEYIVTRDGEQIYSKTFYSIFKPWANVYLRGIAP